MEAVILVAFHIPCFTGRKNVCAALFPYVFAVCTLECFCWNSFRKTFIIQWFPTRPSTDV